MKYILILCRVAALISIVATPVHAQTPTPVVAVTATPLRVGFICPGSGGSRDIGTSARLGAELAVKEINEVGGYLGRPLALVIRDEGRRVSEDLVLTEKVAFTIGFCNSGVALKSLDVFQDNKHLLMIPVATGTAVTAKYPPEKSYVFRMSARDSIQAAALVDDVVRRGFTRIALLADSTGYGEGGFNDVERFLAEKNLKPVYTARFALGVSSLTPQVTEARAAGADVLIGYSVGPELAVLLQARAEARFAGPLYGPASLALRSVALRAGPAIEGAVMVQTIIKDLTNERRTSFVARLARLAGAEPVTSLAAAAQSYDAVHLMMRVMFQTRGDTSGDALKNALENLQHPYSGVITTHDRPFSPTDHDAFTRGMVWLGVWQGGEVRYRSAEEARRASTIRRKETAKAPGR